MGQAQVVAPAAAENSGEPLLASTTSTPPARDHEAVEVVAVKGLRKRYGKTLAVDGIDLTIKRGEIYGLIGPDGAGKSSLMKAVAGTLSFDAGTLEVFGISLTSEAQCERIRTRVGLMTQGLGQNLYADLSVEENIDFFARLRLVAPEDLAARKAKLLAMTRLERFREWPMKQLSGGMKQKLGLVCTLIHEPELVILDEPTTGVDPVSRRDFWSILGELLQEKGMTALVSTAYMDEASRFDRVALMFNGKVLANGEPGEVLRQIRGTVISVQTADQVKALARLETRYSQTEAVGHWLKILVENAEPAAALQAVQETLTGLDIRNLYAAEPELEEIFIALLRQRERVGPATFKPEIALAPANKQQDGIAIEAIELTRDFGSFRAVDQVSFRVPQGEIFGLLGANGAGKTTAIKMLTGIVRPSAGSGKVAGADMRTASQNLKQRIGYMSQAFSLYLDLSVLENINLYAGIYGLSAREAKARTQWVIGMAGLDGHEGESTANLPMGLRQRLALGCALVHRPQVLFLDEPTSGVDPVGRRQFWDILFALSRKEGVTILVTTHYMSEAEHCDHLALMYAGRIVADASPERMKKDVVTEAGQLLEITTDAPVRAMALLKAAGFRDPALFGRRIHLLSRAAEADRQRIPQVLAGAGLTGATVMQRPLSMEDVFVYRVSALEAQEQASHAT